MLKFKEVIEQGSVIEKLFFFFFSKFSYLTYFVREQEVPFITKYVPIVDFAFRNFKVGTKIKGWLDNLQDEYFSCLVQIYAYYIVIRFPNSLLYYW